MLFLLVLLMLAVIAGLLFLDYWICKKFQQIAIMKGYTVQETNVYFWLTFFLGVVGMLMFIMLPDRYCQGKTKAAVEDDDTLPRL